MELKKELNLKLNTKSQEKVSKEFNKINEN